MTYYIATRLTPSEMSKVMGKPVPQLNNKLSETLRSVALGQGVAKTQNRRKTVFYSVNETEYNELTNPAYATLAALKSGLEFRPLLAVNREVMSKGLEAVNSKHNRRMDRKEYAEYQRELQAAMAAAVVKLNDDAKVKRPQHHNPGVKVGDWLTVYNGYRESVPARIVKLTEHSYTYEVYLPRTQYYNRERAFDPAVVYSGNVWDGSAKIKLEGNEDLFHITGRATKRFTKRDIRTTDYSDLAYLDYWYTD